MAPSIITFNFNHDTQRLKLLHKSGYTLVFSLLLLITGAAIAGEKVDQMLEAQAEGSIYIENMRGNLTVVGWDKPQIQLQGELDDATEKLIFKRKGHKAMIKVVVKNSFHHGNGSDLKVFIPRDTHVRFNGVDTDFSFSTLTEPLEGQTINGDLIVDNVHSTIKLSSVSGQVKISQSSGTAVIESVSGAIHLSGAFQKAQLKSLSGDIGINIDQIEKMTVENVSGNIVVNGRLQNDAKITLTSVSGDLHYTSVGQFNGNCEVASQFGGKINNQLTADKPWAEMLQQRMLKFESGDGSGKLVMNTITGSVTLDK